MYFQGEVRIYLFIFFQPSRQIDVSSPASRSNLSGKKKEKRKNNVDAPTLARQKKNAEQSERHFLRS